MIYRFSLKQFFTKILILTLMSAAIGYWLDGLFVVISLTFLATLIWQYRHVVEIINWLWHKNVLYPPESKGVWGHIYDGIYRRIKTYRSKQKKLNAQVRQFRDGAEALPDAVIVLDLDLAIRWANKKASRILDIHWPADSGQRINNLVRSPKLTKYLDKRNFELPCKISSPRNDEQQLELRFMVYGDNQYLLLVRDVSQSNRLEAMRRDFVANVSHELKTPLTVVRGYVEMIKDDPQLAEHWRYSMQEIDQQVNRMDRLVQQLLVLSKVEVAGHENIENKVNVAVLITQIVSELNWLIEQKKHHITLNINSDFGLLGIESEIKSAFTNLIINAVNYTPDNGEITIGWQKTSANWQFFVKDNGCGILSTDIPRLTERFYRVDKSRSRDTGGTGLGLAIVKHVANHHNAHLQIDSEYNKGSRFSILFREQDIYSL